MKKILVLTLVVLVAGAAFAATDPVFSGKFSLVWGHSFSDGKGFVEDLGNSAEIDLKATIDDFNTVSVKMGLGKVLYWDDKNKDKVIDADELSFPNTFVKLNNFTLKTDVTGAMGLDLPVSVTTTLGKFKLKAANVGDVAPYALKVTKDVETGEFVGLGLDIGIMDMVTIGSAMFPSSFWDATNRTVETGVWAKATGLFDLLDATLYYIASDSKTDNVGASLASSPFAGLKVGAGMNYNLDALTANPNDAADKKGVLSMKLDAAYTGLEGLKAGLSLKAGDISDFINNSELAVAGEYQILDFLSVYGGVKFMLAEKGWDAATGMGYDAGVSTSLGALKVQLGASDKMKYKAPSDKYDDVVYVKVSASF